MYKWEGQNATMGIWEILHTLAAGPHVTTLISTLGNTPSKRQYSMWHQFRVFPEHSMMFSSFTTGLTSSAAVVSTCFPFFFAGVGGFTGFFFVGPFLTGSSGLEKQIKNLITKCIILLQIESVKQTFSLKVKHVVWIGQYDLFVLVVYWKQIIQEEKNTEKMYL